MGKFKANYRGIGQMLKTHPTVIGGVVREAGRIATVATVTAPRRSGHYAESFEVSVKRRKDRTIAKVTNTDDAALSIEFGTSDTPAHYTLTSALVHRGGK
jgi:hypothetical protein